MPQFKNPPARRHKQRGAGALIVVLVLFFVMALVAAYSSRNMIFEQKTSANQYRSTQAFEVAEAGVEWGLAMLNSGRIDALCTPTSTNPALTSFRERYLDINAGTGVIEPRTYGASLPLTVRCFRTATGWSCSCPDAGTPTLTPPSNPDPAPAFQLTFVPDPRPGVVTLRSYGCTQLDDACLASGFALGGDAAATIDVVIALKGALSTPPAAALTAGQGVNVTAAMGVVNADAAVGGITINAGGIVDTTAIVPQSLPGTPAASSIVANDTVLSSRHAAGLMFSGFFGMAATTYQRQPAAIVLNCPADCSASDVRLKALLNPGRILWLIGNMDFDSPGYVGSPTSPVVMVVVGNVQASVASTGVYGLVYSIAGTWTTTGSFLIQGAAIAENAMDGAGTPNIVYDLDILRRLRVSTGSFVRVPGGWRDFL